MEKLRLDPESLRVQSFAAIADLRPSGALPAATRPHVCDPVTAWC